MDISLRQLKEELKKYMVSNGYYVGNSDVANMLRQLADEFDD